MAVSPHGNSGKAAQAGSNHTCCGEPGSGKPAAAGEEGCWVRSWLRLMMERAVLTAAATACRAGADSSLGGCIATSCGAAPAGGAAAVVCCWAEGRVVEAGRDAAPALALPGPRPRLLPGLDRLAGLAFTGCSAACCACAAASPAAAAAAAAAGPAPAGDSAPSASGCGGTTSGGGRGSAPAVTAPSRGCSPPTNGRKGPLAECTIIRGGCARLPALLSRSGRRLLLLPPPLLEPPPRGVGCVLAGSLPPPPTQGQARWGWWAICRRAQRAAYSELPSFGGAEEHDRRRPSHPHWHCTLVGATAT